MSWLPFAILASISFGFYNFFSKLSANSLSPSVALMFIAGSSFLVATIATIFLKLSGQGLVFSIELIKFPILAGLATGIAEILFITSFAKGAPLSLGTAFVIGGAVFIATLLGLIFLKESFNLITSLGFIFTVIGLILLSRA